MFFRETDSPIGPLIFAGDDAGIRFLIFKRGRDKEKIQPEWEPDRQSLKEPVKQVDAYFRGRLTHFDFPLAPQGTPFQLSVWNELLRIPYGETISYGELARRLENPKAVRAVGLANGSNPIAIVIPCHRVIGSNGTLVGYGGGLPIKQALLALERGQGRLL
jgi:methylated-DNA-[protein]-cysteine S-methyltransferase